MEPFPQRQLMSPSMVSESYLRAIPQGATPAPHTVVHTAAPFLAPEAEEDEDEASDHFPSAQ
jgi:hypothetical protein